MQGNSLTGVKVRMRWNAAAGRKKKQNPNTTIPYYKNKDQSADWDSFLLLGGQDNIYILANFNIEMGAGRITAS